MTMDWFIRKFRGGIQCLKEHGFCYTVRLFLKKTKNKLKIVLKRMFSSINSGFRSVAKRIDLGFIHAIKVRTYHKDEPRDQIYYVFLFGKQIYPNKKKNCTNTWADPNQPIIYFKINRMADYTVSCIQHWVDVAYQMKADFMFLCDNTQLEYQVLKDVKFPSADVKFMPSMRKALKSATKVVATPRWQNAACVHLTPFYNAEKNNIKKFWAIDADDTMFCLSQNRVVELLKQVQSMADQNDISIISLDMWHSRTLGKHWSWGIAYINDNTGFCETINQTKDFSWINAGTYPYRASGQTNVDWYFTYLKNHKEFKIETFYVENAMFIHWGNFLKYPAMAAAVYYWSSGKLIYPIYRYVHCDEHSGFVDIASDCICVDINATREEGMRSLYKNLSHI